MKMEEYMPIELIITRFDVEDVINTSGNYYGGGSGGTDYNLNPDLYEGNGYYFD